MKIDDKTKHVFAGILISLLSSWLIFYFSKYEMFLSSFLGLLISVIVGAGKELIWDKLLKKGVSSVMDFIATAFGGTIGFVLFCMIFGYLLTH